MKKEKIIKIIEGLYPADSIYPETKEVGILLLKKAKIDLYCNWRCLPKKDLIKYANLCLEEECREFNSHASWPWYIKRNVFYIGKRKEKTHNGKVY